MKHTPFSKGVLLMLLSATGLCFTGLLGKIGVASFSLPALVFWRFAAAFALCSLLLLCTGRFHQHFHFHNTRLNLLRAGLVLGAQYSFYYYLEHNHLLNAIVLLNTGPMFIPLIDWLLLRNRVGKSTWIGTGVSFLGVICLLQPDEGILTGISMVGLLSGFFSGASQVVFGINSKTERSEHQVLILLLLCALLSAIPYVLSSSSFLEGQILNVELELLVLGLGAASIGNQLARAKAYGYGTPSRLAPFLYFSVLLAGVLDWIIYQKIPNTLALIGAALVVLGGVLKIYLRGRILKGKN